MSADRWTQCPKCKVGEQDDEGVGLAEHHEMGIYPGEGVSNPEFYIKFEAECRACGWSFKFTHEEKVPKPMNEAEARYLQESK